MLDLILILFSYIFYFLLLVFIFFPVHFSYAMYDSRKMLRKYKGYKIDIKKSRKIGKRKKIKTKIELVVILYFLLQTHFILFYFNSSI